MSSWNGAFPPFAVSNLYLQSAVCDALFMCTTCDLNVLYSWVLSNVTHRHVRASM